MRIVFFVHRFWPSIGGVEKYVEHLARSVIDLGHEVTVVAGAVADDQPARDEHRGIEIRRFPATRSPMRCRLWFARQRRLFREADVVSVSNTHMLEYFRRMLGRLVDWRRVFLIRHGMACIHPVPDSHRRRAQRAQGWVAGVAHDGRFIETWLGVRPDICPAQGLDPTAEELAWSPPPEPRTAIYLGRLEPDAGLDIYLDAVRAMYEGGVPTLSLDIVGGGSLEGRLRERIERQRLPVRLLGRVENAQNLIPRYSFAFVNGRMAIQEAMARRRPVLAVYTDPLKRDYVCGETFSPFLIACGSGPELAGEVVRLARSHEVRCNLTEAAFAYARTLSWKRTAEVFLEHWFERIRPISRMASDLPSRQLTPTG